MKAREDEEARKQQEALEKFSKLKAQRAKQEKKFAADLAKGDRVITKSGMHGKVVDLNDKDNSCVMETMAGKIKFDRSAISMEMSKKLNPVPAKK